MHHPYLPDVQNVNINHKASREGALSRYFHDSFRKNYLKNLILSILSFGVYPYKKYKHARLMIAQALAARKLFFFRTLQDTIEGIRKDQCYKDPRQSLNSIFVKTQSEKVSDTEKALEFKAIYTPSEILLFITNPIRDKKLLQFYRLKSRRLDYLKMWNEIKKKAHTNQYRQIQNINFCNKTLMQEWCLTSQGIHDRLTRTSVARKSLCLLTKFKELSKAFQEIVIAYQDLDELTGTNSKLHSLLKTLSRTSKKDIETLQTYLASRHLPRDLPLELRRQLIYLGNQQDVLYHISEEQQLNICALILNEYQWNFLISIQEVSQVTLNLLDWAFEESCKTMKKPTSFIERILMNAQRKAKDDPQNFPNLSERIAADSKLAEMTIDFANELNREWPSLHLYENDKLIYQLPRSDSLTQDNLIQVYHRIQNIAENDPELRIILQQALSKVGRNGFQSAIQEGVFHLLGEKSEYFLPILSNTDMTVKKNASEEFVIDYTFEQIITRKGEIQHPFKKEKYMVISQPFKKGEKGWISLEPEIKIAEKKSIA